MAAESAREPGLGFEDIDTLILTHLHWDHCQNADLFTHSRVLVHPKEIDYAQNPNRHDVMSASYFADMLRKLRVDPISDGDEVAPGVSIIDTPGHTRGHISIVAEHEGERVLVAGDAMPDGGTVRRKLPYNVFWDVNEATESVEKMLAASDVFYPGHNRPFRLEGDDLTYLHGPMGLEVEANVEGGRLELPDLHRPLPPQADHRPDAAVGRHRQCRELRRGRIEDFQPRDHPEAAVRGDDAFEAGRHRYRGMKGIPRRDLRMLLHQVAGGD